MTNPDILISDIERYELNKLLKKQEVSIESIMEIIDPKIKEYLKLVQKEGLDSLSKEDFKYKSLFDSSIDGIIVLDKMNFIVDFNVSFTKVTGFSGKSLHKKHISDLLTKKSYKRFLELYNNQLLIRNSAPDVDLELRDRNNKIKLINLRSWVRRNEQGKIIGLFGIIRDKTDKKKGEMKLEESKKKYQFIVDNVDDVISIIDHNFKLIYINDAQQKYSGFTKEEIFGKSPYDFIHPEDINKAVDIFRKVLKKGIGKGTIRMKRKGGDYSWMEVNARSTQNYSGEQLFLLVSRIIKNIEPERIEIDIESEYFVLDEISPLGIFFTNESGEYLSVNKKWCEINETRSNNELENRLSQRVRPEDKERFSSIWKDAIKNRKSYLLEYQIILKNGSFKWVLEQGEPIYGKDSLFKGFIGTLIDISERKKKEIKILESEKLF